MTIADLINKITTQILNPVIVLLFVLATILFLWGVIIYIVGSQGEPGKLKQGRSAILWGIVGMFIMVASKGIIDIVIGTFDLQVPARPFSSQLNQGNAPPSGISFR